jgi:glycosyltransferase involved in cell wall biosynthesis
MQYNDIVMIQKIPLSVIILTKNAEETLEQTLQSVGFAKEIIALDDASTDSTLELLQKYQVHIESLPKADFAEKRTYALTLAQTDWILYVDSDEIVTPELTTAIKEIVNVNTPGAYQVRRRNYFLGTEMYPDYVDRLFHKSVIQKWQGSVHESPVLTSSPLRIEAALIHHTHRSIQSMLAKTNEWSEYEADLRLQAKHPPVAWWRLVRIAITFFNQNFFGKRLYQHGRTGLFESYFQMLDKLIVYTKLWERQQKATP